MIAEAGSKSLFWLVTVVVWVSLNLAIAAGFMVLLFVMFGNASWSGVMQELGNLCAHYTSAPLVARSEFHALIGGIFAVLALVVSLLRFRSLRRELMP